MYHQILVPVDLAHTEQLEKALKTAADLAKHYQCPVCYVAVTSAAPGSVAHNPKEFGEKLEAFAKQQGARHGHTASGQAIVSHDPTIDLDANLMKAVEEQNADLVVMQSHVPNLTDYIWPSNGGTVASHSRASVFVVR